MKKVFFSMGILLFSVLAVKAQNKDLKFGLGFNVGIPVHNLSGTSLAAGVDLLGHYKASSNVAVTGDIGYTALFAKSGGGTSNLIPLRIGLRYYASPDFYVGGKIGVGFLSNPNTTSVTTTAYSVGFGYVPKGKVEFGASYDGYSKNGTIGLLNLRVGLFL